MDHAKPRRQPWDYLFIAAVTVAVVVVALNRLSITDWLYFRSFTPSTQVITLADEAGLNAVGRHLLYRGNPKLIDRASMNQVCEAKVIGCITTSGQIYILSDDDGKYHDEIVVTAAHEMLHLAYRRLNRSDRQTTDQLVEAARASLSKGELEQLVKTSSDDADMLDELHSVLGTTSPILPPELGRYYDRYFSHRTRVADAYQRSQ